MKKIRNMDAAMPTCFCSAVQCRAVRLLLIAVCILSSVTVSGQTYPSKPIRIVTSGTGGGNDFSARVIAQALTGSLGQQIVVENRAIGLVAADFVAKAPADGYTLLFYSGSLWIDAFLRDAVAFDPARDFSAITLTATSPNVLVVHPSLPARSVKDLIILARTRPGVLNYASAATGSAVHLAAELFNVMAGVNIVRIPYKSSGSAVIGLLSGQMELMFATSGSVSSQIGSGKLRGLAVTSQQPSTLFPQLPTVAGSGLPGYEMTSIYGAFAPPKTPEPLVSRLNQEIVRILNRPDVKEKFLGSAMEATGSSPDGFVAIINSDMAKWGAFIKKSGIREK
jgi:tripartite-type tricarboxylate transporter receptor subunit TctC